MDHATHRIRRAFSLVEVTISLILVGGLMLAAASAVGTTASMRRVQVDQSLGLALAQDLAGEILRCRYEDPDADPIVFGPEADESTDGRDDWDDVDDYHDWSASPPVDRKGVALPGLAGWTRHAHVAYAKPTNPMSDSDGGTDSGLKRIKISVTAPDGNVSTFVGLRSRLGSYDQDPALAASLVNWVGITMQIGPDPDRAVTTGVHVANQMPQSE